MTRTIINLVFGSLTRYGFKKVFPFTEFLQHDDHIMGMAPRHKSTNNDV